jgi:ABC-type sugar transport system ATPase subunit
MSQPLIEMRGMRKHYGGVQALAGADFAVFPREIHALVGDNAAGKSSLIKALSGAAPADEGVIRFDGKEVEIREPRDAKALGIETVYQDLALADNLDIPANIFLGRELLGKGILAPFLDLRRMNEEAAKLLGRLKIRIPDLRQKVRTLSGGQRQCVGIARAVYFNARVIILDEPTAALDVRAEAELFERFLSITHGLTTILVSHRFSTVRRADRIVVLDGGRIVEQGTHDELLGAGGRYAHMFLLQAGRFNRAAAKMGGADNA